MRLAALLVLLTACEVGKSPEVISLRAQGEKLFFGRAGCATCHKVGQRGDKVRGPNLGVGDDQTVPVARRARRPDHPGVRYVVESIVDPDAFTVPGYARGVMPHLTLPPVSLTDDEVVALALFLAADVPDAAMLEAARTELPCARLDRDARK